MMVLMVMVMMVVRSQTVPGLEQWEEQQRAVIQAERELVTGSEEKPDLETRSSTEISTEKSQESTPTSLPDPLRTILKMSFQRLLSKLQPRTNKDDDQPQKSNLNSKFSVQLKEESGENERIEEKNRNYLDHLLASYTEQESPRSVSHRVPKPLTILPIDDDLLYDDLYIDVGRDNLFLQDDDFDIRLAMKESRQLDRDLRRFLHKLNRF